MQTVSFSPSLRSNAHIASTSVYCLTQRSLFEQWADAKRASYPASINDISVEIENPFALSVTEKRRILACCERANMAIYKTPESCAQDKAVPMHLAQQLGLKHIDKHLCGDEDGIASIQNDGQKGPGDYIPYTNKPINWHTDGYYNTPEHTICGMVLHCANSAAAGGENALIDHEMVYLYLREKNPEYIRVLMQNDVMIIPPNIQQGKIIRDTQAGPVFNVYGNGRYLHMRYSARAHNIIWKEDPLVQEAASCLLAYLDSASSPVFHHLMQPGEGVICNNVLHKRKGFVDDPDAGKKRLVYRARSYDRIMD